VGGHFIYASWYKQSELGKRAAIFCAFGNIGNMAGGWIQAGLLGSLSGHGGLPAWRLIFIVVSVTTIPIAIFGEYQVSARPTPSRQNRSDSSVMLQAGSSSLTYRRTEQRGF
jgi:ACS family pantothenate transporter-like MFS transporter